MSVNVEIFKALDFAAKHFSPGCIRVFDRGYDSDIVCEKLLGGGVKFIVRATDARYIVHKGKAMSTSELSYNFKGKYALDFQGQKGEKRHCKISITPIELPKFPCVTLNFMICKGMGEKPLMLLTNVENYTVCAGLLIVFAVSNLALQPPPPKFTPATTQLPLSILWEVKSTIP